MKLGAFEYYILTVSIIGFILFAINTLLYTFTAEGQIDSWLTITALIGGSPGIIVAILLIDPKAVKGNMMSRVFISCIFVIQVVIYLIAIGKIGDQIRLDFWNFFNENKAILMYLIAINILTFIMYAIDKIAAIEGGWRLRIVFLLGLAFLGGSIGALLAMYILRHKTRKDYFTVGVPLIIVMQVVVIFYLMNPK